MPISHTVRIRLEKAATVNGFDVEVPAEVDWLGYQSSHASLRIRLTAYGDGLFVAALSQRNVWGSLADQGASFPSPPPPGAAGARGVTEHVALHRLLGRTLQLSRTLPDELYNTFAEKTTGLPRETEVERLVVQRIVQDVFRAGLMEFWDGRCAITGLAVPVLLRASHIKAWADCERDEERLDVFNGLQLAAHLDAAFDLGLISVADDGTVLVSDVLDGEARVVLRLERAVRIRAISEGRRGYLAWHRLRVFRT
jgi:putative restriction endonuclease